MIAKTKKPHTIREKLISPCVDVIIKLMISGEAGKKTKQVSLSKSTIKRRIVDMSKNIEQQVIAGIRKVPCLLSNLMNLQMLHR